MTKNTIKITGLIDLEITMPDGMVFNMSSVFGQAGQDASQSATPAQPAQNAPALIEASRGPFPDTKNGQIAAKVAEFIKAAGKDGASRHQITRKFGQIKSHPQREAILKLLPDLFYRKSMDAVVKGRHRPVERWTYFYS